VELFGVGLGCGLRLGNLIGCLNWSGGSGGCLVGGTSLGDRSGALTLSSAGSGLGLFNALPLFSELRGAGRHALLALRALRLGGLGTSDTIREALDLAGRIDDTLLTGVEGVANAAKVDAQIRARRTRFERVATGTGDRGHLVTRVDTRFHGIPASSDAIDFHPIAKV
jgi:hypothetical protein